MQGSRAIHSKCARILIADDHLLVAEAIKRLLEPEYDVVGIVGDGRALLQSAASLGPQLIILDVAMPLLNGLDATAQIKRKLPNVKIVFLTMNDDPDLVAEAFRRGASAYLLKSSPASELVTALREVCLGRSFVSPSTAKAAIDPFLRQQDQSAPSRNLTGRQREVMQLLAEGKTMKETGCLLNMTARTVAFHKYRIMDALELRSSSELVRYAIRHHIIEA
jgi:DNA-binding NarL/FixJ family response regulator